MKIFVDIDDTICYYKDGNKGDYSKALPYKDRIEKINKLYDEGHEITYWTARGVMTGIDWRKITLDQFKKWGVKFHHLKLDKPVYDIFIDDRVVNVNTFFVYQINNTCFL